MFKKKLIAIVVLLLLLAGGYAFRDVIFSPGEIKEQDDGELSSSEKIIDDNLAAIVNEPKAWSSNPYDYILVCDDFQEIVALGDEALKHMLNKFEISQDDGLQEYVMALACADILGEDPVDNEWSTGMNWYQMYRYKEETGGEEITGQEPLASDDIHDEFAYPSDWPDFEIVYGEQSLTWLRGDSNYTGKAGGKVGNTCFGMNEGHVDKLKPNIVKPETELLFKAAEVAGLNEPQYELSILNQDKSISPYPLNNNKLLVPKEEGEYIFIISVDWGNGHNNIVYWFKLKVITD